MKTETVRKGPDPVARLALFLLGLAASAAAVLLRYSPRAITAEDAQVYFRLFRSGEQAYFALPVWLLWLIAPGFFALLIGWSQTGRRVAAGIAANPGNLSSALVALALLVLTLLPAVYSRTSTSDQSIIVYLLFGSVGITGLLLSAGPVFDPSARRLLRCYDRMLALKPAVFVGILSLLVFVAASLVSWRILEHMPRIHDDVAQLFQARLFAQGRLFAASPPVPQFFDMMLMINDGKWYSQYPPGHPLMLMLGVLIHAPWLVNPLLGALTVVVTYFLGREVYDEPVARLGTLLLAFSPYLVLTSGQFINHSSSLFFTVLFMLLYFKSVKGGPPRLAPLPAGLALGMVVLVRPYTGLLIALPFVFDAGYRLVKAPGRNLGRFALMALGALAMTGLLVAYNYLTNGKPFELGYVTRYGAGHGLGFNRSGWGQVYTLAKAFAATGLDLNAVNRWFFELPIPALLLVAALFALRKARRHDSLLLGVFVSLVAGYFFYWWHALVSGPRWEYESLPALALLMARGMRAVPQYFEDDRRRGLEPAGARQGLARLFVLCGVSLFAVAAPNLVRGLPGTFGTETSTVRAVRRAGLTQALVVTPRMGDVFLENRVPPGGNVIYAKDLGELNPLLTRAFPGRGLYYASRDTLRKLPDVTYEQSPLKQGIDTTVAELSRVDLRQYQSLFIPTDELAGEFQPVARRNGLKLVSYRTLDRISVGKRNVEGISFPAIAAWVLGDPSEHVVVFQDMNRGSSFISGGLKFTFIGASTNGIVALYDIRPAR